MKYVFHEFKSIWPVSSHKNLESLITGVRYLYYPDDFKNIATFRNPETFVVVMRSGDLKSMSEIIKAGFIHIVQINRPDFAQEILTSALMIARPMSFLNNPLPFILSGGTTTEEDKNSELILPFSSTENRGFLLTELEDFLKKKPKTAGVLDLCIQTADELITNALFHAPVNSKGEHIYQYVHRTEVIRLPDDKKANLFCKFTDYRIVVGCEDFYGSINRGAVINHLVATLEPEQIKPKSGLNSGAGMGLRFMIGNSANFYMYCNPQKQTLVACAFLTEGMKANLNALKNIHIGLR